MGLSGAAPAALGLGLEPWPPAPRRAAAPWVRSWRLPLGFTLLTAVLLAALLGASWLRERDHADARTYAAARHGAELMEQRVSGLLDRVDASLVALAGQFFDMQARGRFNGEDFARIVALQGPLVPEVAALQWWPAGARIVPDCDAAALPAVAQMLCGNAPRLAEEIGTTPAILGPVMDGVSRQWVLVLARHVGGAEGGPAGLVSATLPVSALSRALPPGVAAQAGGAALWSRDLSPLWRYPRRGYGGDGRDHSVTPTTADDVSAVSFKAEWVQVLEINPFDGVLPIDMDTDGTGYATAYRRMARYPFYVTFSQPLLSPAMDAAMAGAAGAAIYWSLFAGAGVALFLAAAAFSLHYFSLARGLQNLPVPNRSVGTNDAPIFRAAKGRLGGRSVMNYSSTKLSGLRVLVVDDDGVNREVAKAILVLVGAQVSLAENGLQALDWLENHPGEVDVILMDLQMPEMGGCEAVRHIRRMPGGERLPVAAISASVYPGQREAVFAAGMDAFIPKPVDASAMLTVVSGLVGRDATDPHTEKPPAGGDNVDAEPDLPGLQLRQGLATWKSREIYARYLGRFAREYENFADGLLAQSRDAALSAVHKLKGTAATLALTEVAAAAAQAEHALRAEESTEAAASRLHQSLAVALDSIARFAARDATDKTPLKRLPAMDKKLVQTCLAQLQSAWHSHEFDQVEPLLNALTAALGGNITENLWAALNGFDFHAGAIATRELASALHRVDKFESK